MQRLAREFNFSETTFVLPPSDPSRTCRVRISEHEAGLASGSEQPPCRPAQRSASPSSRPLPSPRSRHYLAAHKGANPLAALTQGYQSAFLACAVLAGTGLALAFLRPSRPRKPAHELPEHETAQVLDG